MTLHGAYRYKGIGGGGSSGGLILWLSSGLFGLACIDTVILVECILDLTPRTRCPYMAVQILVYNNMRIVILTRRC